MTDGPLFIVDNGASGHNGLDYLREWAELASSVDIASGFFEIGAEAPTPSVLARRLGHLLRAGRGRHRHGYRVPRRQHPA